MLRVEFNDIYFYHQKINLLHQFMLLVDSLCLFYQKTSFRANSLTLLNFIFLSVPSFIVPLVVKHNVNCIVTKQRIFFIFFQIFSTFSCFWKRLKDVTVPTFQYLRSNAISPTTSFSWCRTSN